MATLTMRRGEQILRWRGTDGRTLEVVTALDEPGGVRVRSQYLDAGTEPFSARYDWRLDGNWQTRSLSVHVTQAVERDLAIERVGAASWRIDGSRRADLDGCEEIDLSMTPFCKSGFELEAEATFRRRVSATSPDLVGPG